MPFVATFGGFGDFVALVQVLLGVIQALRDVGGSSSQYVGLIDDISDFHALLADVGELKLRDIPSHLHNHLKDCVLRAATAATAFQHRIMPYHASLCPGGTGRWLKNAIKKVQWKFFMLGEVTRFTDQMNRQRIVILGYLVTANMFVFHLTGSLCD